MAGTMVAQVQTANDNIVANGTANPHEEGVKGQSLEPEDCDVIVPFLDQESHSTVETSPSENEVQMVGKRYFSFDRCDRN
jgi:hypothetical protein